jgi:hypothetical protein
VTLTPNAEGTHPELQRARELMGRCRLRAAARACAKVLAADPDNVHAVALKARLDAATKTIPIEQAQSVVQALIDQHPNDTYLRVASSVLLVRGRDRSVAIAALRQLSGDNPTDAYIHQVLAGQLGCDKSTWDDAWVHYKLALGQGPLLTPSYRAAAYFFAKRQDPDMTSLVLGGASALERAAIRTRALGARRMFLLFGAFAVAAMVLDGVGNMGLAVTVFAIASIWSGWASVANAVVGCWKCARAWLLMDAAWWLCLVLAQPPSQHLAWEFLGAAALGGTIGVLNVRRPRSQGRSATKQSVV